MLQYNGINLNVTKLHTYRRESVWSGNDYVHTKVTLVVTATFNPNTAAYQLPGRPYPKPPTVQPPVNPVVGGPTQALNNGVLGIWTDEAVRSALKAPRKTLRYDLDGALVLYAPLPGFSTDAFNGPKPIFCNVTKNIATKTFMIDYGIEVYLNECNLFSSGVSPLVSYQWEMEHDVDEHFYTTRTIRGRAVFRSDIRLQQFPQNVIDDFRSALFHPIPRNMKRDRIYVKVREDGLTLDVSIVDREKALNINPNLGVTRIEGIHEVMIESAGSEATLEGAVGGGLDNLPGHRTDKFGNPLTTVSDLIKFGSGIFTGASKGLPVSVHRIVLKIWGNKNSNRQALTKLGGDLIQKRFAAIQFFGMAGYKSAVRHDLAGKYVELEQTWIAPPIATVASAQIPIPDVGLGVIDNPGLLGIFFPLTDDSDTTLVNSNQTTNPAPTGDGLSRGSYVESLATSILKDQCSNPSVPPAATRNVNYPGT